MTASLRIGAVILCGGQSSRMGQPKHLLPFGKETVLQRVVRTLFKVTQDVAVVAAKDQELPELPESCQIVRDDETHQGPLSGLMYGLRVFGDKLDAIYLTGCDVPMLRAEFVREMIDRLGNADLAVPFDLQFTHPLAAVYRTSLLEKTEELLRSGERRPRKLIESVTSILVPVEELRFVDPQLDSLRNMNSPEDYAEMLRRTGNA
jgi:molybdopterin-guanine dinucleotide biosynthesis protein A